MRNEHQDMRIEDFYGKNVYGSPNFIEDFDEQEKADKEEQKNDL